MAVCTATPFLFCCIEKAQTLCHLGLFALLKDADRSLRVHGWSFKNIELLWHITQCTVGNVVSLFWITVTSNLQQCPSESQLLAAFATPSAGERFSGTMS